MWTISEFLADRVPSYAVLRLPLRASSSVLIRQDQAWLFVRFGFERFCVCNSNGIITGDLSHFREVIREFGEGPRNNVADMEHAAREIDREWTTSLILQINSVATPPSLVLKRVELLNLHRSCVFYSWWYVLLTTHYVLMFSLLLVKDLSPYRSTPMFRIH
jgi:hypothetical protein